MRMISDKNENFSYRALSGTEAISLKKETIRKLFHMAWAIIPVLYYFILTREQSLYLLSALLMIWISIEVLRKFNVHIVPVKYLRDHEKKGMPIGTMYQLSSSFLVILLFSKDIAILAMLFNAIGDSVTAMAGALLYSYLGKEKVDIRDYGYKKSGPYVPIKDDLAFAISNFKSPVLMGIMAISCFLIGALVYPEISYILLIAGSIGAVIADCFPWKLLGTLIDDDLLISLMSGVLMFIAALL